MMTDYRKFESILCEYFEGSEISGIYNDNVNVELKNVVNRTWKNLWNERAVYKLSKTVKTDQFSTFFLFTTMNLGELIVQKKKKKLLRITKNLISCSYLSKDSSQTLKFKHFASLMY